jgi:hypothetical protein
MATNIYTVYYITNSDNEMKVSPQSIFKLKKNLNDFYFDHINNYYRFAYKNLNVIISYGGNIQLSLISTHEISESINLLAKMADKINSILEINSYSKKVMA